MPHAPIGYQVKQESVVITGAANLEIRSLLDRQQFYDPEGVAERLGISSACWPLFGLVWPSARVLAARMAVRDIEGRRVLELGCGLALASLVAHRRKADVTASDLHPLTEYFLKENLRLNALPPMAYRVGDWQDTSANLGQFDLIIGSDVLYERDQPAQLSAFIDQHANDGAEVIIVDPNRGNRSSFNKQMGLRGFAHTEERVGGFEPAGSAYNGRILSYHRN